MNSIIRLVALVAGLTLLMHVTPSWGQPTCQFPGCNPTVSDAHGNTAGGTNALANVDETSVTGGRDNTAFGGSALTTTTTGNSNTAVGVSALRDNITGDFNTAAGAFALQNNTIGTFNTASGVNALGANGPGSGNTANGVDALGLNVDGEDNTAIGVAVLLSNTGGIRNTAIGRNALFFSTGNKNIALGYNAGVTLTTGNHNIYVAHPGAGAESQTIRVGLGQSRTFIAGISTTNMAAGELVSIDPATGQLGVAVLSSAHYKDDIAPMGTRSEGVHQLRPVTFSYKDDAKATMRYGLVAEEVAAVYPQLVTYAPTGEVRTVKYQELIPMLLNELQRQHHVLQSQQQELAELRALVGQSRGKVVLGGMVEHQDGPRVWCTGVGCGKAGAE
jgi:Chaperone of endosialidase